MPRHRNRRFLVSFSGAQAFVQLRDMAARALLAAHHRYIGGFHKATADADRALRSRSTKPTSTTGMDNRNQSRIAGQMLGRGKAFDPTNLQINRRAQNVAHAGNRSQPLGIGVCLKLVLWADRFRSVQGFYASPLI